MLRETKLLQGMLDVLQRVAGAGGGGYMVVSDQAVHNVRFTALIPREDTVLASLKLEDAEVLGTANANVPYNLASVDLKANIDIITAPAGKYFTSVDLTSGSVGLYLA